ncbi:MAG: hypothetical protein LBB67_02605 [Oscillospiraceae bacterium]|nr:hypothetical protein [Oscillospiraceae bacterium]
MKKYVRFADRNLFLLLAGLILPVGLLPFASAQWVDISVNLLALPWLSIAQYAFFPVLLVVLWAVGKKNWLGAKVAYILAIIACAVQVFSLFWLSTQAKSVLLMEITNANANPDGIPQNMSIGFYAVLFLTVIALVGSGVRLFGAGTREQPQRGAIPAAPVMPPQSDNPWRPLPPSQLFK